MDLQHVPCVAGIDVSRLREGGIRYEHFLHGGD